jgi:hypothetical protein
MTYDFLVETYETERVKIISTWSEFREEDMPRRPRDGDPRGRSVHEQMVHQCVSEDLWFRNMLGIDVNAPLLPEKEARLEFMKRYAEDSEKRPACRLAYERRIVVVWGDTILRCAALARVRDDAQDRAQRSPSRPANGDVKNVWLRAAQQLWANGGYRRADAKSRADNLRVPKSYVAIRRRIIRGQKILLAGSEPQTCHRATRVKIIPLARINTISPGCGKSGASIYLWRFILASRLLRRRCVQERWLRKCR